MIVIGEAPITVNPVHDTEPAHEAVVVAIVDSSPVLPTYVRPCVSDVSLSPDENVDEAVEKIPPVNPSTVDVDAPYDVNGSM